MSRFCTKCGSEIPDDARYCGNCGALVRNSPQIRQTSSIEIVRPSHVFGMVMAINIFLDGELIGTVNNGKSARFSVEPGQHNLQLKMNWTPFCESEIFKFRISGGENLRFQSGFAKKGIGDFLDIADGSWALEAIIKGFKMITITKI